MRTDDWPPCIVTAFDLIGTSANRVRHHSLDAPYTLLGTSIYTCPVAYLTLEGT